MGLSRKVVGTILRENGISRADRNAKKIQKLNEKGKSVKQISKNVGCSNRTVNKQITEDLVLVEQRVQLSSDFNGLTWLAVDGVDSYEDCDMWAERFEQALFEGVGTVSPVCVHHPVQGLHSWGIEFNGDCLFWNNPAGDFVKEARKLLESGWFHQSGSDHPDQGYQFFEFMGLPSKAAKRTFCEEPEYIVRAAAVKIAKEIGSIAFF